MGIQEGPFQNISALFNAGVDITVDITQGLVDYPEENTVFVGMERSVNYPTFTINTAFGLDTLVSGAAFNALRQDIIDAWSAASSPDGGWNKEIRDKIAVADVIRQNNLSFIIIIRHNYLYSISSAESLSCTLPAALFTNSDEDKACTPIVIQNDSCNGGTAFTVNAPQTTGGRERIVCVKYGFTQQERDDITNNPTDHIFCVADLFKVNTKYGVGTPLGIGGTGGTNSVFYVNYFQVSPDGVAIHIYCADHYGGSNKSSYFTDLGFVGGETMLLTAN